MSADPSRFTKRSLRTVQMAVKAWRIETAGRIILDGDWIRARRYVPLRQEKITAISANKTSVTFLGEAIGGNSSLRLTQDPQVVVVAGGEVSGIDYINSGVGDATGETSGTFYLFAGSALSIAYSSAPTVVVQQG